MQRGFAPIMENSTTVMMLFFAQLDNAHQQNYCSIKITIIAPKVNALTPKPTTIQQLRRNVTCKTVLGPFRRAHLALKADALIMITYFTSRKTSITILHLKSNAPLGNATRNSITLRDSFKIVAKSVS